MTSNQQDTRSTDAAGQMQPYAYSAHGYLSNGWNPLPLPPRAKTPPPEGFTGMTGAVVRQKDVDRWVDSNADGNIGLRIPIGVLAVDVDCYNDKRGAETIAALAAQYGELPATWSSSSRTDGSRQYFFSAPNAMLPGDLGPGVEVLQYHHRYAVAWPSVHPDTGQTYRWYRPDGSLAEPGEIPAVSDLTPLPESWHEAKGLKSSYGGGHRHGEAFTDEVLDGLLRDGLDPDGGHDDHLSRFVFRLVQRGETDLMIRTLWNQVVNVTGQRGNFRQVEGKKFGFDEDDFDRHLSGARQKLGGALSTAEIDWVHSAVTARELSTIRDEGSAPDEKPKIPAPTEPMPVARRLAALWEQPQGSGLIYWRGEWHVWVETHWRSVSDQNTRTKLYAALEHCTYEKTVKNGNRQLVPWNPTKTSINNVCDALQAVTYVDEKIEEGGWTDGRAAPRLIPVQNGLLDYRNGTLTEHTPRFLNHYSLPFAYAAEADCPQWLAFLESVWPGDEESKATLQEWFGYVLSGRTDLQKFLFVIGATRSGKGTIGRTLSGLLNAVNVVGLSMSAFTTEFGLSGMIGKPLAIIADARNSKVTNMQVVAERILNVTGEDPMSINRKYLAPWQGTLPTRLLMMSNELPNFRDASEAITKRMIVLNMPLSFLGKEDTTLGEKLSGELAGIFNWSLQGLARVEQRGRFVEPEASREMRENLDELANPLGAFVKERLNFREGAAVKVSDVFAAYNLWAGKVGDDDRAAMTRFGMNLGTAAEGKLKKVKKMIGGERTYWYDGVELASTVASVPGDVVSLDGWFKRFGEQKSM